LIRQKLASLSVAGDRLIAVAGCSVPERGLPVPQADTARALPLGIANARFFADGDLCVPKTSSVLIS